MLTSRFSNCHVNLYKDIKIHLIQDRKKGTFHLRNMYRPKPIPLLDMGFLSFVANGTNSACSSSSCCRPLRSEYKAVWMNTKLGNCAVEKCA